MRISTQYQYQTSIDNMQKSQVKLAQQQEQISTGKKLITPSDDPVAAAQVIKLERELSQYEKFDDNINVTERRLQLEETILTDINTAVDRMRELTIQAGNGVLSNNDRASLATEIRELTEYLAGLMNTQDSEGEYLFAGGKGSTRPFQEQGDGTYEYFGDQGQRLIQVAPDLFVPSNDSGEYLFEAVDDGLSVELTGQAVYNANQINSEPFMRNISFADDAAETKYQDALRSLGDLTITVTEPSAGNFEYSITDSGGNPVLDDTGSPITNIAAGDLSTTPLNVNLFGMEFELHEPSDIANANQITFRAVEEKTNLLNVALELADALETPVENGDFSDVKTAVADALDNFTQVAERNIQARAELGARLSSLENISSANIDFKLITESAISRLVDADLAEVISEFSLQQTTLQAAQATFAQVSKLTLFNYIN